MLQNTNTSPPGPHLIKLSTKILSQKLKRNPELTRYSSSVHFLVRAQKDLVAYFRWAAANVAMDWDTSSSVTGLAVNQDFESSVTLSSSERHQPSLMMNCPQRTSRTARMPIMSRERSRRPRQIAEIRSPVYVQWKLVFCEPSDVTSRWSESEKSKNFHF